MSTNYLFLNIQMSTPANPTVSVNSRPSALRITSNYPSDQVTRLTKNVVDKFNEIRLKLDELNRQKQTDADFKNVDSLVREMMSVLDTYTILKTWGGKSRKNKTKRTKKNIIN